MSRKGLGSRAEAEALRYLSQWYDLACTGNDPSRPVTDQPTRMTLDSTHRLVPLPDARIRARLRADAPLPRGTRWVEVKYLQRTGHCHRLHARGLDSVRYLEGLALVCRAEGEHGWWRLRLDALPEPEATGNILIRLHTMAVQLAPCGLLERVA